MTMIFKKFVTILLSLAVLAGTLFIESGARMEVATALDLDVRVVSDVQGATLVSEGQSVTIAGEAVFKTGDTIQTGNGQTASIRFDRNGILRLAPLSALVFRGRTEEGYIFELKQGSAWVNTISTSVSLNVLAGGALLVPGRAAFDLSFDGETAEVRVFFGQVNVGLVTAEFPATSVAGTHDDSFVNSFLVAQGSRAVVSLKKVVDNAHLLRQLLYSKLIKEFQYSLMDRSALASDQWVTQNLAADKDLMTRLSSEKRDDVNGRGLKYASLDSIGYDIDRAIIRLSDALTFTQEKRTARLIDGMFEHFLDAQYLLAFGRDAEAQQRLVIFRQMLADGISNRGEMFKSQALQKLRRHFADLYHVLPVDAIYEAKVSISDLLITNLNASEEAVLEKLLLIRDYMNYAYALAESNQLEARLSLEQYFTRVRDLVQKERAQIAASSFLLSEENQIMDNLLRQYPQFYQDSFFAMKDFLEEEFLKLLPEGPDKNEERQTIISTKIDFLKQLQTFFLARRVALADARLIAERLIVEIQDLQPGTTVGVSSLFALRLQDYGNFLRFLRATNESQLRGSSPQQEYDKFLALQREQLSIEQVIQEFLGEEVVQPTITVDQVLAQITADLEGVGASNLRIEAITDVSQQEVTIQSGQLNGVQFSGDYDWNRRLISNVRRGDELLSASAIRLSSLALILQPVEEEGPQPAQPQPTQEQPVSQAERVAKILLLQKLKTNGINALEENIVVRDLEAGDFVVNGAMLVDDSNVQIAFAFQNKTNIASSLLVRTPAGDVRATESYEVSELAAAAKQIYDQAAETAEVSENP